MNRAIHLLAVLVVAGVAGCASRGATDAAPESAAVPAPVTVAMPAHLADKDFAPWLQGERSRIASARSAAQQRFHDAELACWRRFAVNDCVRKARVERRTAMDQLRQEELLTRDARIKERKKPGLKRARKAPPYTKR